MFCLSAIVYAAKGQLNCIFMSKFCAFALTDTTVSDFASLQADGSFVIDFAIEIKTGPGILSCKYHWHFENGSTVKLQC